MLRKGLKALLTATLWASLMLVAANILGPAVAAAAGGLASGGSFSGVFSTFTATAASGANAFVMSSGARLCFEATCEYRLLHDNANNAIATPNAFFVVGKLSQTANSGTITLSGGTGTAAVTSGARCICTDQTANASVKCVVSGTTLTATGTTTDVITYLCDR